jgi:hypothetical protein
MKNHTIQLGSATPAPSWAGPHAPARLLTSRTHLSAAPRTRHCVAAHLSAPPPLHCLAGRAHTAHVTRACRIRAVADRAPLTGQQGPPHCSCPASATRRPRRPTPTAPLPHPPPFKKGPNDAAAPRPPFSLLRPHTPSTPRQTSSPSVHPALGAPLFLTQIPAAASPSFTRSVSHRLSRFPVNLNPTSPHSLSPRGAELGPRRR